MATASEKSVVLYTHSTPNGWPMSIFLEELKAQYGSPDYEAVPMSASDKDIGKVHNQVKSPWFLKINPNGRIPAITHNGFHVFESSAILLYLAQTFDKDNVFSRNPVSEPELYSEELQWLFFIHGGVGPMEGQAAWFLHYAPEKVPYAVNRYQQETKRLFGVLEGRLSDREYLVGPGKGSYGIADIKAHGWIRIAQRVEISLDEFPNLKAWVDRIDARPAVQIGLKVPPPPPT